MKEKIDELRENIVDQAQYFLTNAGEFYPFGAVINIDGSLAPVGIEMDNEHPDTIEVLKILEEALISKLRKEKVLGIAIGLDVLHKLGEEIEKSDAIQVKVLTIDGESKDYYLHYKNDGGVITYSDNFYLEEGTLRLNN